MLRNFLLVGLGGAAGCMARYGAGLFINKHFGKLFPLATFSVNMVGCFLIGLVFGYMQRHMEDNTFWLVMATGFCGGFTTFSSFALENNNMLGSHNATALVYTLLSLVAGVLLCRTGIVLSGS